MSEVKNIIVSYCDVDKCLIENNLNTPLFLAPFNLMPEDLVLIILKIENLYKIKIGEEQYFNYNLLTINGICNAVNRCMEANYE